VTWMTNDGSSCEAVNLHVNWIQCCGLETNFSLADMGTDVCCSQRSVLESSPISLKNGRQNTPSHLKTLVLGLSLGSEPCMQHSGSASSFPDSNFLADWVTRVILEEAAIKNMERLSGKRWEATKGSVDPLARILII
jgi:hypothetical protein